MMQQTDILRELESIGSKLGNISRAMPYALPEGYFEKLPEAVLLSAVDKDVVTELPKQHPFETPGHYFEQLPAQILAAVKKEEKPKTKVISLGGNLRKNTRLAAAAILLLLAGAGVLKVALQQNSFDNKLASLPEDAVKEYVMQTSNELNIDNSIATTKITLPAQLTEEEITQYLDETGWQ